MSTITYIGPESMGPHYLESGKRPAMPANSYSVNVAVQQGADVFPANYTPYEDRFATLYAGITVSPVCWWHLPQPAPMTEREWWMAQEWKQEFWWEWGAQNYFREDSWQLAASSFITHCDTIEEAKSAAYDHWVAAGRP